MSAALYCTLSPVGGAPLELDELDALLELDELGPPLELLELELLDTSPPLLLEPTLPPVPPDGSSRLLRSGSTPYAHAPSSDASDTKIIFRADTTFNRRFCMSKPSFFFLPETRIDEQLPVHLVAYHDS
jgi:hypothetical protein